MRVVATIILDLEEKFEERKPDIDMVKRFLKSRIHQGSVNEEGHRGRVVINIKKVQADVLDID